MMDGIRDALHMLLGETDDFAKDELVEFVETVKTDEIELLRDMGKMSEEFLEMFASGELTRDEFTEVMEDLVDLNRIQEHKLLSAEKVRVEAAANKLREMVLEGLLKLF